MTARLAETARRDRDGRAWIESSHEGHLVVAAPDGTTRAIGDPDRVTFVRSAAKPFQATASLEIIAGDVAPDLLAVGWASHTAEPEHLAAVTALLASGGFTPADLTTPLLAGSPGSGRLAHNCSGKHALFAVAGAVLGERGPRVLDPQGAVQTRVLGHLRSVFGEPTAVGVDGCGAPAVAVPLARLASGFRELVAADGPTAVVVAAGLAHPHLVGGSGRLESALLAAGVVAKPGAEGVFGAAWRDRDGAAWGVALKVEDGASRASAAALHGFLAAAGVVSVDVWTPPPLLGGGRPEGEVRASEDVRDLARAL